MNTDQLVIFIGMVITIITLGLLIWYALGTFQKKYDIKRWMGKTLEELHYDKTFERLPRQAKLQVLAQALKMDKGQDNLWSQR